MRLKYWLGERREKILKVSDNANMMVIFLFSFVCLFWLSFLLNWNKKQNWKIEEKNLNSNNKNYWISIDQSFSSSFHCWIEIKGERFAFCLNLNVCRMSKLNFSNKIGKCKCWCKLPKPFATQKKKKQKQPNWKMKKKHFKFKYISKEKESPLPKKKLFDLNFSLIQ